MAENKTTISKAIKDVEKDIIKAIGDGKISNGNVKDNFSDKLDAVSDKIDELNDKKEITAHETEVLKNAIDKSKSRLDVDSD